MVDGEARHTRERRFALSRGRTKCKSGMMGLTMLDDGGLT